MSMSRLPAVLSALISDGLGAIGMPGTSSAGEMVKAYFQRASDTATDILFDEFRRGEIDAANVAAEDDRVAAIYRYLRASWEGSARVNLRLLAKAIVGRIRTNTLVADEFLPHADALAALSRDEIVLLATMHQIHRFGDAPPINELWPPTVQKLEAMGWSKDHVGAIAGRAMRSGYVLAASAWSALSFRPSPMFLELCTTVDFTDALRREGHAVPP
jgi:hypothetical protein